MDLHNLKHQVASELGVQIGSKQQNRNQSVVYFGQVGGEMVKRALAQAWGTSTEASITPFMYNTPQTYNNTSQFYQ